MSKSFKFVPKGYGTGKIYCQQPNTDATDFVVDRNSKARIIDVNGDDVEVLEDVPCFDYRGDYIALTDNSYYSFDGVNDYVTLPNPTVSAVTNPSYVIVKLKTGSDVNTEQVINCDVLDGSNRLALGVKSGFFIFTTFNGSNFNNIQFVAEANTKYTIAITKPNTHTGIKKMYINGVIVAYSITTTFVNPTSLAGSKINTSTSNTLPFFGQTYQLEKGNLEVDASYILDRYNGLPIPNKYKGATNVSIGAGSLNIGETYVIEFIGTTDFTVAGASSNTVGEVFECTAIAPGSGTAFKAGNTLNLDKGKTDAIWYDLDHDIQGTVNGAVLNDSTDFGNNTYPLETCPSLLTQGQDITNRFQDSANPVSQTINGLTVGVPQTLSCKSGGVITIVENGGSLLGGAATEVYPFTFTPTHTSVDVTLSAGHSLEHVNLTNTPYAVNHILTPNGGIATRLKDEITDGGSVSDFNSEEFVFMVETKAFINDLSFRAVSISDGTINNRIIIEFRNEENLLWARYIKSGITEGNITGITSINLSQNNKIALRGKENNFSLWVNGSKIAENLTVSMIPNGTLDRINLDRGDGSENLSAKTKGIIYINEYYTDAQMSELTSN